VKVWSLESGPFQSDEAEKEGHSDNIIGQSRHAKGQKLHDPMKGEGREKGKEKTVVIVRVPSFSRPWWKRKRRRGRSYLSRMTKCVMGRKKGHGTFPWIHQRKKILFLLDGD
jgi:hypothetical protein